MNPANNNIKFIVSGFHEKKNIRNARKQENITLNQEHSINRKRCTNKRHDENSKAIKTVTIKMFHMLKKVEEKNGHVEKRNGRYTKQIVGNF